MIAHALTTMLLAGGLALAGCAAPTSYAGISLVPEAVDAEVQRLALMARSGDKQAQLELGIRYQDGNGVSPDAKRAKRLFEQAATDSQSVLYVYQPSVSGRSFGRVVAINTGQREYGLAEARDRLGTFVKGPKNGDK